MGRGTQNKVLSVKELARCSRGVMRVNCRVSLIAP